jgi:hypothetical protein
MFFSRSQTKNEAQKRGKFSGLTAKTPGRRCFSRKYFCIRCLGLPGSRLFTAKQARLIAFSRNTYNKRLRLRRIKAFITAKRKNAMFFSRKPASF